MGHDEKEVGRQERGDPGVLHPGRPPEPWASDEPRPLLRVVEEVELQTGFHQEVRAGLCAATGKAPPAGMP